MTKPFDIIVAADSQGGIGLNGVLPWNLPADLAHFRTLTLPTKDPSKKNAVIMGRRTFESLPKKFKPLPGRINVVLTHQKELPLPEGAFKMSGLEEALSSLSRTPFDREVESIFVIGGGSVYQEAIRQPACRKIYLTRILSEFNCDTFFPVIPAEFKEEIKSSRKKEKGIEFFFTCFSKSGS